MKDKGKHSVHSYAVDKDGRKELRYYQKVQLVVGYDEKQDDDINFCMKMLTKEVEKSIDKIQFDPPNTDENVGVTNIILKDNKIICESGEELHSGNIVEMRYEKDAKNNMIWKPIRIRGDKLKPQFFKTYFKREDSFFRTRSLVSFWSYKTFGERSFPKNHKNTTRIRGRKSRFSALRRFLLSCELLVLPEHRTVRAVRSRF